MDILQQTRIDIIRTLKSPKLYIVMLISAFFLHNFIKNIKVYAAMEHIGITPYVYPVYFSDWMNCIYILLSITVLMSDAPFRGNNELYLSLRMNKYHWILSKILFIFIVSVAFQFFFLICSIIMLLPYLGISSGWGDALKGYIYNAGAYQLAVGDSASAAHLIETYLPTKALVLEFLLMSLFGFALGLLIFLLNEVIWRYSGIIVSLAIICLDLFIRTVRQFSSIKLSYIWEIPSWFSLGSEVYTAVGSNISLILIFGFLILFIFVFTSLILITAKRKFINILKGV